MGPQSSVLGLQRAHPTCPRQQLPNCSLSILPLVHPVLEIHRVRTATVGEQVGSQLANLLFP